MRYVSKAVVPVSLLHLPVVMVVSAEKSPHRSFKDFATWAEEAVQDERMGLKEAAYVKFDLASKLLEGGGFLDIAMRDDVDKARNAVLSQADWDKSVRTALKDLEYRAEMRGLLAKAQEESELRELLEIMPFIDD